MGLECSGQITVTTAGTEVQGPSVSGSLFQIKALAGNTGLMYVGNDGSNAVSSSTGFQLSAGEVVALGNVTNLNQIYVDSSVNGEKVCWIKLSP